jgi:uncharacterized protein (TIGR00251 family)
MKASIVQDIRDGAILSVHIQPNASRTELVGRHGAALKIRIAASPVDGAANDALVRFLAGELAVPVTAVHIQSGAASRQKRLGIRGVTARFVIERLKLRSECRTDSPPQRT